MNRLSLGKDASYINKLNKIEILKIIRDTELVSRAEIVKLTKLSAPTVTRIVDDLVESGLAVVVGEGDSTGGRPPKMLKFDGSQEYVIGIDLGSTSIRGAISNLKGNIIIEVETPTDLSGGVEKICDQIAQLVDKLKKRSNLDVSKILGMGLAVAGLIDFNSSIIEYSPVFNWKKVDLKNELSKHLDLPLFYDNVSRVTAFGELLHGIGKKYDNFIFVNAGYGIGSGVIIDGKPLYGNKGFSGELGHIIVDSESDFVGKDGLRGSLESLSSGYGIAEIAKAKVASNPKSNILSKVNGKKEDITAKIVVDCAKEEDSLATEIFDTAMGHLGIGLDMLIKMFDPQAIVLTGGLTKNGDIFFDKIKEHIAKNRFQQLEREVHILPSSFGEDASLIGALSIILHRIFQFDL
ncbi:ROK family transcriptional regulator [Flagellimonas algicola]|uniref:ROK family transcriptional regulator n=1 Tax=Flagellimonas algicola TaxID=2583815 RepID=A0ABY2WIG5_9FLAO|nr:ROK family transcriptional regulator [Allomuricauda algicola]TMU54625.1 ROK family transcriptional regulator [Allomuricauda algicola]